MFGSDNVSGADNQQERLFTEAWIVGFVDGEGCFSVGFIRQPNRGKRLGYKLGVQVWCEFAVTQGASSLHSLRLIEHYFQVGAIYCNKRYDNHREHLYNYSVRKREDLKKVIIPFFQNNQLRTSKKRDFELFTQCFKMIENKDHRRKNGLLELARIASKMNRRKDRVSIVKRILNDHTHNFG